MSINAKKDITAVILAGGMGRRYGGRDKGHIELDGQPLIEHVLDAIRPQVAAILINANRNQDTYSHYGYPVIADRLVDYQGPLAGFSAGLQAIKTEYMVTLPCDGPLLAADLVDRLCNALQQQPADLAVAHDGERLQPVYALIPVRLQPSLENFLQSGQRKIDRWYAQHAMALADFSDVPESFNNINTPQDHDRLQADITKHDRGFSLCKQK